MTQRDRLPNEGQEREVVYNSTPEPVHGQVAAPAINTTPQTVSQPAYTQQAPARVQESVETVVETPVDRVRWGSIIAGLFTTLSTLIVLSLIGAAIGAATYNPGDNVRNYGIGAGLWGGLSALLAFLLGGWVAARTAAVRGEWNGMLNGAMVWGLAIPLLLYLLGSGIGSSLRTAANTAAPIVGNVAGQAANQAATDPALQATAQAGGAAVQERAQALATPENVNAAREVAERTAWGTLGSLLLGLGASMLGGYLGSRMPNMAFNRRRVLG